MSFPAYADYKNSGVPWLGEVPSHWEVAPGRRQFRQVRDPSLETDEQLSASQKYGVIPQSRLMEIEDQKVVLALKGLEGFKHVVRDDFVISLRSFQGGIEHSAYTGCVSPAYTVLRPTGEQSARYYFYALKSAPYISALQSVTDGIRDGKNISYEQFGQVGLPVPPLAEQRNVAIFLDRETAKIDALVAEQERLIALLKEKRQAVISHAVTKGLNPNTPMKDSGVEWLGQIPTHWDMSLLKRCFKQIDYGISESLDAEGAIAILRMGNIRSARIVLDDLKYVDEVDPSLLLQKNDLLFNRTNSLDQIAKVGLFAEVPDYPVSMASYLVRLRVTESMDPEFLSYLLNTDGIIGIARSRAFVAIGQCNLNPTRYGEITIAVPPYAEQLAISAYLKPLQFEIDALVGHAQSAITLLQERRAALISAAVTGKIDVRAAAVRKAELATA